MSATSKLAAEQLDTLVLVNRLFANEQGRDKFNKTIQYGARLLAYHLLTADPKSEWGKKFTRLSVFTAQCRKILGLFKWLGELEKLEKMIGNAHTPQQQISVIGTLGMFNYWLFDNAIFLSMAGLIQPNPKYAKYSMLGFNIGLTCALIIDAQQFVATFEREKALRSQLGLPAAGVLDLAAPTGASKDAAGDSQALARSELVKLYKSRQTLLLNFVKNGGDWLVSVQGSGILEYATGRTLSEPVISTAGLASALAVVAQTWRSL